MRIKELLAIAANRSYLLDTYAFLRRKITKSHIAILMYHRVSSEEDNWRLKPLDTHSFEQQIEYLCRKYELISLDRLAQCIQNGEPLPKKAAVITFDDGYKDNYLYAYPILKKYQVPATIFLTTGHIGTGKLFWYEKVHYIINNTPIDLLNSMEQLNNTLEFISDTSHLTNTIIENLKNLPQREIDSFIEEMLNKSGLYVDDDLGKDLILSWNEIKEMSNDGITFGAHTVNHPILTNLTLQEASDEITQSKNDIEQMLGQPASTFSYPNGAYNSELAGLVKRSGFTCAVTTIPKLISRKADPYELSRIGVGRDLSDFNKFKIMICGLWGDLGRG